MFKNLLISLIPVCIFLNNNYGQSTITLKKDLDSVFSLDQKYRNLLTSMINNKSFRDSIAKTYNKNSEEIQWFIWLEQRKIDSLNLLFVEDIIQKYGYPGKTLVGENTNEVAWYIIQHSDKIENYFHLIKTAGKKDEIPKILVAKMEDRLLMQRGKKQKYGTQGTCKDMYNGGKECFIWPIKNYNKVNRKRKKMGFNNTVEENALEMNIEFRKVHFKEFR